MAPACLLRATRIGTVRRNRRSHWRRPHEDRSLPLRQARPARALRPEGLEHEPDRLGLPCPRYRREHVLGAAAPVRLLDLLQQVLGRRVVRLRLGGLSYSRIVVREVLTQLRSARSSNSVRAQSGQKTNASGKS